MRFENLTDGIIGVLEDAGLRVGDGEADEAWGWQDKHGQSSFLVYCVVHPLLGGISEGSIEEPHGDGEIVYQVSCYGPTRSQTEKVASDVDEALKQFPFPASIAGLKVRYVDDDVFGGARRMDEVQPPMWQGVPRYRFHVTAE